MATDSNHTRLFGNYLEYRRYEAGTNAGVLSYEQWLEGGIIFNSTSAMKLREELTALRSELEVTDKLYNEARRVLQTIPECPSHGECVPHALEWITESIALRRDLETANARAQQAERERDALRAQLEALDNPPPAINAPLETRTVYVSVLPRNIVQSATTNDNPANAGAETEGAE